MIVRLSDLLRFLIGGIAFVVFSIIIPVIGLGKLEYRESPHDKRDGVILIMVGVASWLVWLNYALGDIQFVYP